MTLTEAVETSKRIRGRSARAPHGVYDWQADVQPDGRVFFIQRRLAAAFSSGKLVHPNTMIEFGQFEEPDGVDWVPMEDAYPTIRTRDEYPVFLRILGSRELQVTVKPVVPGQRLIVSGGEPTEVGE